MSDWDTQNQRVFVYGTLRAGERNHAVMGDAKRLGTVRLDTGFTLYDTGAYPAAIAPGAGPLVGEVFAVDAATFARLDHLECYPIDYTRITIDTDCGPAWIYLWVRDIDPGWPVIGHGDWCRYRGREFEE